MAAMDAEVNPDDEETGRAAAMAAPASLHPDATGAPSAYVSTACLHRLCAEKGACRQTCKFCDAPCACPCHRGSAAALPEPWVDQARNIARELLRYGLSTSEAVPPELLQRIASDPSLFWLRGEERPPGEWRDQTKETP